MNQEEYEAYKTEKARRRARLGIPENASPDEAKRIIRQGLLDRGFTTEQIDNEFSAAENTMNWWAEYDAKQAEMEKRRAMKEELNLSKISVGGEMYYNEDAIQPYIIESPLDLIGCANDDIPIGEAVANNGGRFCVCNLDLLDAEWL